MKVVFLMCNFFSQGKDGWFWDHYEKSVPMSTYLVAFLVSDFTFKEAPPTGNGVVFKIWTRKDAINQVNLFLYIKYCIHLLFS